MNNPGAESGYHRELWAEQLAQWAHLWQKYGEYQYIAHCFGVRNELISVYPQGHDARIVALLHDTLEDTAVTYDLLLNAFGGDVAIGVRALTRLPKNLKLETYNQYIDRIIEYSTGDQPYSQWIPVVKLADLRWNRRHCLSQLDLDEYHDIPVTPEARLKARHLERRYRKAIERILAAGVNYDFEDERKYRKEI